MIVASQYLHILLVISGIAFIWIGQSVAEGESTTADISSDYYIERERKANWFQAFNNCSVKHMNLVTLDTKEKTEKLTTELRKIFGSDHPNIWTGGKDKEKNQQFVWMPTDKAFSYTNWAPRQPDNKNDGEHCVMLWGNHNYLWNDGNCLSKITYVCEKRG